MADDRLLLKLYDIAKRWNYSPESALHLLEDALRIQSIMGTPNFGPWPIDIEEYKLSDNRFMELPNWAEKLIPEDAKLEKHRFTDGREIAKLVDASDRVLLAVEL